MSKQCNNCGLCSKDCPLYNLLLRDTVSPRGKGIMQREGFFDEVIYLCTLCGSCTKNCPINLELDLRRLRKLAVDHGKETPHNKQMIENVRNYGNPYGKVEEEGSSQS